MAKKEINNTVFMALINGLKYDDKTGDYTFKNKKYVLKDVKLAKKHLNGDVYNYYFVNINEPTDLKTVSAISGIPTFDGFNNVDVDKRLRKLEYSREYYKKVTYNKRKKERAKRAISLREQQAKAREQRKEELKNELRKPKYEPIKCLYCGTEFTPYAKNQKFHTDECRKRYYSEKQAQDIKDEHTSEKVCPICNTVFTGTPRDKYCSPECYKVAQKELRKERYARDKVAKTVQEQPKKKAFVVKKNKNVK